jgi:growth factor-regulated tyrosine kinase substrate
LANKCFLDRATSEYLPAGQEDLSLNLDVCDEIRSREANAREAARVLKRRIGHRNPNVQLLALKVSSL